MKDDSKDLVNYLNNLYFVKAHKEMDVNIEKIIDLVRTVKFFFNYISVESIESDVSIAYVDDSSLFNSITDSVIFCSTADEAYSYLNDRKGNYTVFFNRRGEIKIFSGHRDEVRHIFKSTLGYRVTKNISDISEHIFTDIIDIKLHPTPGESTLFPRWDFDKLIKQLKEYHIESASYSSCKILEQCWHDDRKILFTQKPEHFMRDSILQFLRNTLGRIASIKPEQNTDASKPVDLNIEFHGTNRIAIIEVKWLGTSINAKETGPGTSYSESRANDGSKQLCDYIDKEKTSTPRKNILGVLVVFDGRRKGINISHTDISYEDAFHYKDKDITYSPAYYSFRKDFSIPLRFFMHPKMSN